MQSLTHRDKRVEDILFVLYIIILSIGFTYSYLSFKTNPKTTNYQNGYNEIEIGRSGSELSVANTGDTACFVRVAVDYPEYDISNDEYHIQTDENWDADYGANLISAEEAINIPEDEEKLYGYYYCTEAVMAGESTSELSIPFADDAFVYAESIQKGASSNYLEAWKDFL